MVNLREPAPRGTRIIGVIALLLGAPVFAELLQSYLPNTQAALEVLLVVVFLAPLYGGAALLIREVALRTGRGWRGRLLLAASFGVLMPTFVDGSLFTPMNPDIGYWDEIMGSTRVGRFSVYAVTSWVLGHVVMSVGAPLVVVEALLPEGRARPWLGRLGLVVLALLGAAVAFLVHIDPDGGAVEATMLDYAVSLTVILALIAVAMSPVGRPLAPVEGRGAGRPILLGLAGFALMAGFDLAPASWAGVLLAWVALVAAGCVLAVLSRSTQWTWRHLAAFTLGGVLARTLTGFLSPVPQGVSAGAKLAQNLVFLLLVLGTGGLVWARTREPAADSAP
jgi:hypothetical protein